MSMINCSKCGTKHERNAIPIRCPSCKTRHKSGDGKLTSHHRVFWTCHICGHKFRHGQKHPGGSGGPVVVRTKFNKDGY